MKATGETRIRVLIGKPGLDGHDRGAKVIARALRDAGMEVIYTGLHQTPETIANAAVQEDVDFVGLSILSGAHNTLFPAVLDGLAKAGAADVPALREAGVAEVFGPGSTLESIVAWIRERAAALGPKSLS